MKTSSWTLNLVRFSRAACCAPVGANTMSASAIFVLDLKGKVRLMLELIVDTHIGLFDLTQHM